jgi:hypothetical protein
MSHRMMSGMQAACHASINTREPRWLSPWFQSPGGLAMHDSGTSNANRDEIGLAEYRDHTPFPRLPWTAFVWLASFLFLSTLVPFNLSIYDEGSILTGAMNVLAGRVPTVDFWTVYPGGAYVWPAILFAVFGPQMITLRLACAAVLSIGPALGFALLYRRGVWLALFAAAGLALWIGGTMPNFGYPPPLLVMLGAVVVLLVCLGTPGRAALLGFGACTGIFALMRLDYGFFCWAAIAIGLLRHTGRPFSRRLLDTVLFGIGAGLVLAGAVAVYVVLRGWPVLNLLFQRLLAFPAGPFHAARDVPFPVPFAGMMANGYPIEPGQVLDQAALAIYYLTMLLVVLSVLRTTWDVVRPVVSRDIRSRFALSLFALTALIPFLGRSNITQGWAGVTLGLLAVLWVMQSRLLVTGIAALLILIGGLETGRKLNDDYLKPSIAVDSPRAVGMRLHMDRAWYNDLIRAARGSSVLYSGPDQHQHVNANDTLLYFLAERLPPTGYYEVHPLITDQEAVQKRILDDFMKSRPDVAILFKQEEEANLSRVDSGVTLIDNALTAHCGNARRIAKYEVLTCQWEP